MSAPNLKAETGQSRISGDCIYLRRTDVNDPLSTFVMTQVRVLDHFSADKNFRPTIPARISEKQTIRPRLRSSPSIKTP